MTTAPGFRWPLTASASRRDRSRCSCAQLHMPSSGTARRLAACCCSSHEGAAAPGPVQHNAGRQDIGRRAECRAGCALRAIPPSCSPLRTHPSRNATQPILFLVRSRVESYLPRSHRRAVPLTCTWLDTGVGTTRRAFAGEFCALVWPADDGRWNWLVASIDVDVDGGICATEIDAKAAAEPVLVQAASNAGR